MAEIDDINFDLEEDAQINASKGSEDAENGALKEPQTESASKGNVHDPVFDASQISITITHADPVCDEDANGKEDSSTASSSGESSEDEEFAPAAVTVTSKGDCAEKREVEESDEFDFSLQKRTPEESQKNDLPSEIINTPQSSSGVHEDHTTAEPSATKVSIEDANLVGIQEKEHDDDVANSHQENEWDKVKNVNADSDDDSSSETGATNTLSIDSQSSLGYLKDTVLSLHRGEIQTSVKRSKFQSFLHWITTQKLKDNLIESRDVIFCLAKHPYNSGDATHFRMILSVYKSLTGDDLDVPKLGSHWERIGFQGNDPGTDFRGTGMLGLLCLVHLTCKSQADDPKTRQRLDVVQKLYQLSRDETQNFPFALMSINWTRICLQIMREGKLNKYLNSHQKLGFSSLQESFLELHVAVASLFLSIWKRGMKTIIDSGVVLQDLENEIRNRSDVLVKNYQNPCETKDTGRGRQGCYEVGDGQGDKRPKAEKDFVEFSKLD